MNPPHAFDGPRGGEARRIWQWSTRDSTQGIVKTQETTTRQNTAISQLARTVCPSKGSSGSQGVQIIQGGQDVAVGPQGRCYGRIWQNRGFSSY
jgi:hypothetical protein